MRQTNLDAYALIIGIGAYHNVRPLKKATTDAQDLYMLLREQGYAESNIALLLDDEATKPAISDRLEWLTRRASKDTTLLIFFAGHGAQRVGGFAPGEYLCPVETDWMTYALAPSLTQNLPSPSKAFRPNVWQSLWMLVIQGGSARLEGL